MSSRPALPLDPLFWIGAGSCAGALVLVEPWLTLVGAAAAVSILVASSKRRALGVVILGVAIALLVVSAWRARRDVVRHERERARVTRDGPWPSKCVVEEALVAASPTVVGDALRVEVEAREAACDERAIDVRGGHLVVYQALAGAGPIDDLGRGDVVGVTATLAPPYELWAASDPRPSAARRRVMLSGGADDVHVVRQGWGVRTWIDRARAHVRARIRATYESPTSAAMARALVLGEGDLALEEQRAFRKSGLAHLLAVSGMHLVLVVMGIVRFARFMLVRAAPIAASFDVGRLSAGLGIPLAWAYADFAGGSGSAVRAAWMCSTVLLARTLARRPSALRGLGLSLVAMSLADPLVIFDLSFVLSASATAGLLTLGGPLREVLSRWPRRLTSERPKPARAAFDRFVLAPLATTLAATIACAAPLAGMAAEVSIGGLVANLIAVPIGEAAALPLCLAHTLLGFSPEAERGSALVAGGALELVRRVAQAFSWAVIPVPPPTSPQLVLLVIGATAYATHERRRRLILVGGVVVWAALEVAARRAGAPPGVLRATFIDVGQGDSALVDLPDGSSMLIDGGGLVGSPLDVGDRVILPLLAQRRRRALDVVVLSHPHPDHYLGLDAVLVAVPPKAFWDTGQGEREVDDGPHGRLLTKLRALGVAIRRPSELCGRREIGGAVVEVLAPCPSIAEDRGANDNSFVIRLSLGRRAFLFMGDAEHTEEAEVIARAPGSLAADVLKVGHHGSRTSTTGALVDVTSPTVAVISCGVRNRFGHPHPQTLETLRARDVRLWRTDRHGSVVVTTDGETLDVSARRPDLVEP